MDHDVTCSVEELLPTLDDPAATTLVPLLAEDSPQAAALLRLLDSVEHYDDWIAKFPEPYLLPEPGLEGFVDVLALLWERLVAFFRYLRETVLTQHILAHAVSRTLKFQVETAKLRSDSQILSPRNSHMLLKGNLSPYAVHYKVVRDIGQFTIQLRAVERLLERYRQYIERQLIPKARQLQQRIGQLQPQALEESLVNALVEQFQQAAPQVLLRDITFTAVAGSRYASNHLLGNQRLYLIRPAESGLKAINQMRLRLDHSEQDPRPMPAQQPFPHFNGGLQSQCYGAVLDLLSQVEAMTAPTQVRQKQQLVTDIERAYGLFQLRLKQTHEQLTPAQRQWGDQLLQTGRSLTDWLTNPYSGLIALGLRLSRAAHRLCKQNQALAT